MKNLLSMYKYSDADLNVRSDVKPWVYVVITLIIIIAMGFVYRAGQLQIQADCEKVGAFRVDTAGFKCEAVK